jgi:transcription termination factor Rho
VQFTHTHEGLLVSETTDSKRRSDGLSGMLLPELKQLAQQLGIAGSSAMRKSDLVTAIGDRQKQASVRRSAPKAATEIKEVAHNETKEVAAPAAEEPVKSESREGSQQEPRSNRNNNRERNNRNSNNRDRNNNDRNNNDRNNNDRNNNDRNNNDRNNDGDEDRNGGSEDRNSRSRNRNRRDRRDRPSNNRRSSGGQNNLYSSR